MQFPLKCLKTFYKSCLRAVWVHSSRIYDAFHTQPSKRRTTRIRAWLNEHRRKHSDVIVIKWRWRHVMSLWRNVMSLSHNNYDAIDIFCGVFLHVYFGPKCLRKMKTISMIFTPQPISKFQKTTSLNYGSEKTRVALKATAKGSQIEIHISCQNR